MAGLVISFTNLILPTLPNLSFLLDDDGVLIGYQHTNGQITIFPAMLAMEVTPTLTAGQDNATPLKYRSIRSTNVGAIGLVVLPHGIAGMRMRIWNNSASSLFIYPPTGERQNAQTVNTGSNFGANGITNWVCAGSDGTNVRWFSQ